MSDKNSNMSNNSNQRKESDLMKNVTTPDVVKRPSSRTSDSAHLQRSIQKRK